jgi:hypothetical protein
MLLRVFILLRVFMSLRVFILLMVFIPLGVVYTTSTNGLTIFRSPS